LPRLKLIFAKAGIKKSPSEMMGFFVSDL
jgi:hypothetical protein